MFTPPRSRARAAALLLALAAAAPALDAQRAFADAANPAAPAPLTDADGRALVQPTGTAAEVLAAYVRLARERNLALARTRLADRQAALGVTQARGALLPSLGVDARYSEFSGVVNIGDFINPAYEALNQLLGQDAFPTNVAATLPFRQETKLKLQQPLYVPAAVEQWRLARIVRRGSAAQRDAAIRQLDADIQLAWLGLAGATQAVDVYRANERLLEENVRVAERLVQAGLGTTDATYRARADLAELVQQRVNAEQQRDGARRLFNLLLDRDPETDVAIVDDSTLLPPIPMPRGEAVVAAQNEREELVQAAIGVEAASAQQRLATTPFLPTVALAADWGIQGDQYRVGGRNNVAIASVVFQWNLFNGGQDAARREAAAVASRAAELQEREARRQVTLDVEQRYDALRAAQLALDAALARRDAALRSFALVARRYEEGLAPHVEFIAARAARTGAELGAVVARYTYAARHVELVRAAALTDVSEGR